MGCKRRDETNQCLIWSPKARAPRLVRKEERKEEEEKEEEGGGEEEDQGMFVLESSVFGFLGLWYGD